MKKSLALFTVTIVLALCALLVAQHFKLARVQKQFATNATELAQARGQLEELQASNQKLETQRRNLRRQVENLSFPVAPVRPTPDPAKATAASDASAPTNALPGTDSREKSFGGFLSKMMNDPDTRKYIRDQQRQMMDSLYEPLIKRLGLTSEQATAFKDFLADNQMRGAEKATSLFGDSATNRAEVMATLAAERKEADEQIKAFLGDAGYAQYQEYQQTLGERTQLNQFRMQNAGSQDPITDQQAEQLLELIREEKQNVKPAGGEAQPGTSLDAANLQAGLTDEQVDKLMQTQETINQRVYERARDLLSPDQMEAFGRFQTNQMQMMRMGMSMARKFFAPEASTDGPTQPNQ